jgi:septal ring factor EnvC (AmiA/AmiB activator)
MNINELYQAGISPTIFRFITNPLRKILFRFLRPYFEAILKQNLSIELNNERIENISREITQLDNYLKEMETNINNIKDICSTTKTDVNACNKDIEAMTHRFARLELQIHTKIPEHLKAIKKELENKLSQVNN